jgi:Arc/MetJ-type ribon-helix-helix transcriptional regulator
MQRITISVPESLHERVVELGGSDGPYDSKSEAVRGLIHDLEAERDEYAAELRQARERMHKHEADMQAHEDELTSVREEYDQETDYLETQIERLQRTNLKILEDRDRDAELELYVDDRREWEQASILTRTKWRLVGKT